MGTERFELSRLSALVPKTSVAAITPYPLITTFCSTPQGGSGLPNHGFRILDFQLLMRFAFYWRMQTSFLVLGN